MKATHAEIERYLNVLSAPGRIMQATKDLDGARLQWKADGKSWSLNDILTHLRSCADLWTHSIYAMLAENEPAFSNINERKWAKVTRYAELSFIESLQVYSLQRKSLVRVLKVLPLESWERAAIIFERKHTIFTQVRRLAKHESEHVEQIESLLQSSGGTS